MYKFLGLLLLCLLFGCKENPTKSENNNTQPLDNTDKNIIIGQNQLSLAGPFGSESDDDMLTQILYLSSEIGKAGTIKGIAMMASTSTPAYYTNFQIYLYHVSRDELEPSHWKNHDPIPQTEQLNYRVLLLGQLTYGAQETDQDKWHTFAFDTKFSYNGTDNLLVTFRRKSSGDGTAEVDVYGFDTIGSNRILNTIGWNVQGGPGELQEKAIYIKLLFD